MGTNKKNGLINYYLTEIGTGYRVQRSMKCSFETSCSFAGDSENPK